MAVPTLYYVFQNYKMFCLLAVKSHVTLTVLTKWKTFLLSFLTSSCFILVTVFVISVASVLSLASCTVLQCFFFIVCSDSPLPFYPQLSSAASFWILVNILLISSVLRFPSLLRAACLFSTLTANLFFFILQVCMLVVF